MKPPRWTLWSGMGLPLVLVLALGSRVWYVNVCADQGYGRPAWSVQGDGGAAAQELQQLTTNLKEKSWFASQAPLSAGEETTGHIAPGYAWLHTLVSRFNLEAAPALRWFQAGLGGLTALLYYFFARRLFQSNLVGFLAGLGCALHPFYVVNAGELADGVVATFLVAASLALGTRLDQEGGTLGSFLFGLCLAGLTLVRAAALPFALAALLWFLLRCRGKRSGWFYALLAFLGFANGLAPWMVRNWRQFGEPTPVVVSAGWHLWLGNHPDLWKKNPPSEDALSARLGEENYQALRHEPNQAHRYGALGKEALAAVIKNPGPYLQHRLASGTAFVLTQSWLAEGRLGQREESGPGTPLVDPPLWFDHGIETWLQISLLALILLGLWGWRLSLPFFRQGRLLTLAALLLPLPYLLTHGEWSSGPRLPLDGVWFCFAAYAVGRLHPLTPREPEV